ncbi:MAG TPA: alpha/beta fold hydrolase [Solirubrobacteraceae bacterium]
MLVHGMGMGAAAWADEVAELAGGARVLVVDRRGYGATPAPEPYGSTTVAEQAEDLVRTIEAAGAAPAVLAGADFGALACLDLLLRHPAPARAAVLADPPLLSLVPEATDALAAEKVALEERLRDDGPRAAMEAWLGHPTDAAPTAFFADYGGLATLTVTRRELRALRRPIRVVTTSRAPAHVRAAAAALLRILPDAAPASDVAGAVRELL